MLTFVPLYVQCSFTGGGNTGSGCLGGRHLGTCKGSCLGGNCHRIEDSCLGGSCIGVSCLGGNCLRNEGSYLGGS